MNIAISYEEISGFIAREFKIKPQLTAVDDKTVEISYKPNILMPTISVKIHIEAICSDVICLSYDCSNAAALIIAGSAAYLEEKIPDGIEINTADKRIRIYPQRFKQIENVLKYIALSQITLEPDAANIKLVMV